VEPASLSGQEIHLLPKGNPRTAIVRLGDVAEIHGGSQQQRRALEQLELFPQSSARSWVTASEIQEELTAQGWNLLQWRVTGANRVQLSPASDLQILERRTRAGSLGPARPLVENSRDSAGGSQPLRPVTTPLTSHRLPTTPPSMQQTGVIQAQWLAQATDSDNHSYPQAGPAQPSTGQVMVWTTSRDLSRGQILTTGDLEPLLMTRRIPNGAVTDAQQIVGMAVRQSLVAGQPIVSQMLEPVKYVQRGKEVRLVSRIGEIEVSTTARCLADGGWGQVVAVESLDRKRQYFGQVIGFQVVQVANPEQVVDGGLVVQSHPASSTTSTQTSNGLRPASPAKPTRR